MRSKNTALSAFCNCGIKRFKNALREAARVYAKIVKMGFSPEYLNIGGGVGVDYDGSQTTAQSSANYSLQEFANDAVYVIGDVCKNEEVAEPHIVTESVRLIFIPFNFLLLGFFP